MEIPGYRLLAKCGRGGAGEVWLAEDAVGRRVALKTVEKSAQYERELAGLRSYARLPENPHLIRVFHVGEVPECLFYTMEMADPLEDGEPYRPATLANVLEERGRLCAEAAAFIADELLSGIGALHRAGLIHRDIKPENILYVNDVIKLSDIGLLRAPSPSLSIGGTLGFIPPERLAESSGCRSPEDDLYALGKTIYCAWSGNSPELFPAIPAALLDEPGAKKLNAVILTACAGAPEARFHSAEEFSAALKRGVPPTKKLLDITLKALRTPPVAAVAAAIALAAVVAIAIPKRDGGKAAPNGGAPPENPIPAKLPMEFSVSDGTDAGTVLYSFTEKNPEAEKNRRNEMPSSVAFNNEQYWRPHDPVHIRREYRLARWEHDSRGALELLPILPREFRMTFELETSGTPGEVEFGFFSADRQQNLRFRLRGGTVMPQLSAIRGDSPASERTSAAAPHPDRNRIEFLRSKRGLRMSVNEERAFDELPLPYGARLYISARCGENAVVTVKNLRIDAI